MKYVNVVTPCFDSVAIVPDIETLSLKNTAQIIAIGAVAVNIHGEILGRFYINIDPKDYDNYPEFAIDEATLNFWNHVDRAEAKASMDEDQFTLYQAIYNFSNWVASVKGETIWGNGAEFDNAILKHAFDQLDFDWPFKFYNHRCLRTLCSMLGIKISRKNGIHHNALDDAENQAEALIKCMNKIKLFEDFKELIYPTSASSFLSPEMIESSTIESVKIKLL